MRESNFTPIETVPVDHSEGPFSLDPKVLSPTSPRSNSDQQLVEELNRAKVCGIVSTEAALDRLMRATQSTTFVGYITEHEI